MKYKIIYNFILTLIKKEWIFNAFEESAEKTFHLNKLISATHNNKNPILFLNKSHKTPVVKWKMKNMSVNKLMKQMKTLILTLKITFSASVLASSYSFVAVSQPTVVYILQTNFSVSTAAVTAAGNLKSTVTTLGPNQCAFCWLEGYWKLWNEKPSCSSLIMFIQTGKMHLNINK